MDVAVGDSFLTVLLQELEQVCLAAFLDAHLQLLNDDLHPVFIHEPKQLLRTLNYALMCHICLDLVEHRGRFLLVVPRVVNALLRLNVLQILDDAHELVLHAEAGVDVVDVYHYGRGEMAQEQEERLVRLDQVLGLLSAELRGRFGRTISAEVRFIY